MRKISVELEFNDDFEPGDCHSCPFSYKESYYDEDEGYDYWDSCVLGSGYDECWLRDKFNIK